MDSDAANCAKCAASGAKPFAASTPLCNRGSTNAANELAERLAETSRRLQAESVLAWREYAFCLYPESTLREFLSGLLHRTV